ncbi:Protein fem-1-like protein B [Armadillidium nasatum]|uniref:Protein fem-1-like protein B n=1 Tax=Armadillidium nasatum TaxID=96803 RepID=A0A5N5SSV7_9CRUS|nr:Protein fem-1-like protein B [Armadillidium nasatum]
MSPELEVLKNKIFHASKVGMSVALYDHLTDIPDPDCSKLLGSYTEEEGQKCTPLLIASRNGHEKAVRTLLKFQPDLEMEGTVKFDGYVIEGASPLWCAAGAGHLSVVKMLVRAGADVNHPTKSNSTPLRAACFDGRLDIVKYLTNHNANIHITNKYNNTCLMIAAYKGHTHIVQFLLDLGANPDERANCGATALHFAAECGHVEIVKELLKAGAKICKNEYGITPLIAAAERTRAEVVEYFINNQELTKEEKIDAYELLGASFASDKDNYDIGLASMYLMLGMQERYRDPNKIKCKEECKTVEELKNLTTAELHMESLVIRERILGSHNPEVVPHPVIFRGAVFADNARFDKCLNLWLHALRLKQSNKVSVVKDLLRFAQASFLLIFVFSQMLHVGLNLDFNVVEEILESTRLELERNCQKHLFPGPKDDIEAVKQYLMPGKLETNLLILKCSMS